jgi:hypothetical protein
VVKVAIERLKKAGKLDDFILGGTALGTYSECAARNFVAIVNILA